MSGVFIKMERQDLDVTSNNTTTFDELDEKNAGWEWKIPGPGLKFLSQTMMLDYYIIY